MALTNRTLILFKYFWETTDEAHPVSLADISAHLKEHGITADPRTLRSDIEQLVEFGVDIVKERRVQNLYHVATRHFEAPEVKLLIDAVQSARFITPGKSKELVKRLTTFVAPGDAALLERHLYIDSRVKAVNESVYISVDRIDGLQITQNASLQKPEDFDVSAYFTQEFSMLNGKTCCITLLCENTLMNSIIDRFGEDVPTQIVDENHFGVETTVNLSSNFYGWVFASGGKMRITAPQEAVDGFQRMLENFSER